MRLSQMFFVSLREVPAEAELVSHKLLLRACFIRKLAAGVYTYLPLAWRSLLKIIGIVREEMNKSGAQEVLMPFIHPAELWQETGRWDEYGDLLMKLQDRQGRWFCLGPTHEEPITDLARQLIKSYRQLPINLYQIATKFRDELRPRGGLIRAREFIMKDAYSFDRNEEGLEQSFEAMRQAYIRIFRRCGLPFIIVEAEAGAIGGTENLEFMVIAENGEDRLLRCSKCGYAANRERAERRKPKGFEEVVNSRREGENLKKVITPNQRTVEEVSAFLKVKPSQLVKTLIYVADGEIVAAMVRGDHELNEAKLARLLGKKVAMADAATIENLTNAPVGFSGPLGLKDKGVKLLADYDIAFMRDFVVGANEADAHLVNVNWGRDFPIDQFADLRFAEQGDGCPKCEGNLEIHNAIEVGHIFKLGTRYSEPMKATFVDEDGKEKFFLMGCYGIGISRILSTIVEVSHDEDGIIFPISIAPFEGWVLPIENEGELMEVAERIYADLKSANVETVIDDRDERAGVKFKDMDLVGVPIQIVVGRTVRERSEVEIRLRRDRSNPTYVPIDKVVETVCQLKRQLFAELLPDEN
ncbi:MAG: proline--tRNA ligase [Armatimonadetes bacterium]|nr:proline--tRNA ligase [Armatimonadota bacterium]MDW8029732.1 proline--tRNA ligase [Armatimonadota bacterium]